jgi:hypothetical protein
MRVVNTSPLEVNGQTATPIEKICTSLIIEIDQSQP